MFLAVLVIGRRALREGLSEVVRRQQPRLAHHREGLFGEVQEVAPVPVRQRQDHRARFLGHRKPALLHILGALQQLLQRRFIEAFQHQNLATRQKRAVQLEARIFRRGADQRHHAAFDEGQEAVLLGPVEAVDFVDEEQRALTHLAARFGTVERRAKLLHAQEDRADCLELKPCAFGQKPRNRRLAGPRRAPKDDRGEALCRQHPRQGALRPNQVVLPHHIGQRLRAQPVGQRPGRAIGEASGVEQVRHQRLSRRARPMW